MIDPNTKKLTEFQPARDDAEIDLVEFLAILIDGKWIILWVTSLIFLLGVAKAFLDEPIYKADVILQVDDKPKMLFGMKQLDDAYQGTLPVLAEVELIKSRKVLGEAIRNLNLDIEVNPKYFPIIGKRLQISSKSTSSKANYRLVIFLLFFHTMHGEERRFKLIHFQYRNHCAIKNCFCKPVNRGIFKLFMMSKSYSMGWLGNRSVNPFSRLKGFLQFG